jgi:hypothetical protein
MAGIRGVSMDVFLTETYFTVARIGILPTVLLLIVAIIPFWPIFRKAGFPGALSLLMLIPGVNLVLLYVVAFSHPRVSQ